MHPVSTRGGGIHVFALIPDVNRKNIQDMNYQAADWQQEMLFNLILTQIKYVSVCVKQRDDVHRAASVTWSMWTFRSLPPYVTLWTSTGHMNIQLWCWWWGLAQAQVHIKGAGRGCHLCRPANFSVHVGLTCLYTSLHWRQPRTNTARVCVLRLSRHIFPSYHRTSTHFQHQQIIKFTPK